MTDLFGTSVATAGLSVTVVADTLFTLVPGAMPVPKTDMPARIPLVDAKVNTSPEGASTMVDAVDAASKSARPGDTVMLAPACASFDMFKDFEDRGDQFKKAVSILGEEVQ